MAGASYEVSDAVLAANGDYIVVGGVTGQYSGVYAKVYVARVARE